jgi:hypothetical protein
MFDRLRAAKDAPAWGDLIGGIDRYIANKPADREWLNPGTFINQGRWEDQMPPCSDSPSRELWDGSRRRARMPRHDSGKPIPAGEAGMLGRG